MSKMSINQKQRNPEMSWSFSRTDIAAIQNDDSNLGLYVTGASLPLHERERDYNDEDEDERKLVIWGCSDSDSGSGGRSGIIDDSNPITFNDDDQTKQTNSHVANNANANANANVNNNVRDIHRESLIDAYDVRLLIDGDDDVKVWFEKGRCEDDERVFFFNDDCDDDDDDDDDDESDCDESGEDDEEDEGGEDEKALDKQRYFDLPSSHPPKHKSLPPILEIQTFKPNLTQPPTYILKPLHAQYTRKQNQRYLLNLPFVNIEEGVCTIIHKTAFKVLQLLSKGEAFEKMIKMKFASDYETNGGECKFKFLFEGERIEWESGSLYYEWVKGLDVVALNVLLSYGDDNDTKQNDVVKNDETAIETKSTTDTNTDITEVVDLKALTSEQLKTLSKTRKKHLRQIIRLHNATVKSVNSYLTDIKNVRRLALKNEKKIEKERLRAVKVDEKIEKKKKLKADVEGWGGTYYSSDSSSGSEEEEEEEEKEDEEKSEKSEASDSESDYSNSSGDESQEENDGDVKVSEVQEGEGEVDSDTVVEEVQASDAIDESDADKCEDKVETETETECDDEEGEEGDGVEDNEDTIVKQPQQDESDAVNEAVDDENEDVISDANKKESESNDQTKETTTTEPPNNTDEGDGDDELDLFFSEIAQDDANNEEVTLDSGESLNATDSTNEVEIEKNAEIEVNTGDGKGGDDLGLFSNEIDFITDSNSTEENEGCADGGKGGEGGIKRKRSGDDGNDDEDKNELKTTIKTSSTATVTSKDDDSEDIPSSISPSSTAASAAAATASAQEAKKKERLERAKMLKGHFLLKMMK